MSEQILSRMDDMGDRLDGLEGNINTLAKQGEGQVAALDEGQGGGQVAALEGLGGQAQAQSEGEGGKVGGAEGGT